jgi:hypothetical protein
MAVRVSRGSSSEPLIPDIAGMTKLVENTLSTSKAKDTYTQVISHFGQDGRPVPNVEEILSHIRSLRQVVGKDSVRGLLSNQLDELDHAICEVLTKACSPSLPSSATPYHLLASWIGAIERAAPIEIFTTNYDLLVEEALESNRVPYFDGFVGSNETFFDLQAIEGDKLPARWCRLWKIHGSLARRRLGLDPSNRRYGKASRDLPFASKI